MGCGFSTEDTKASDEERILKASDGVTGKAETTAQTRMGGTLAKKSPAKKRRGDSKCKEQGDFLIFLTFFFCFCFFAHRGDCVSDAQARRHNLQILSYVHT